jgi:hypothetical protein
MVNEPVRGFFVPAFCAQAAQGLKSKKPVQPRDGLLFKNGLRV